MKTLKIVTAALASAGLAATASMAIAGETAIPAKVLAPTKAAIFDVGAKRALTYYEATDGACKVTVLLADRFNEATTEYAGAVRFRTVVQGGTSDRVDSGEGPSLAFSCAPGATTMMIQKVDRLAYAKTAN